MHRLIKPLVGLLPLAGALLRRHMKCDNRRLLRKHCSATEQHARDRDATDVGAGTSAGAGAGAGASDGDGDGAGAGAGDGAGDNFPAGGPSGSMTTLPATSNVVNDKPVSFSSLPSADETNLRSILELASYGNGAAGERQSTPSLSELSSEANFDLNEDSDCEEVLLDSVDLNEGSDCEEVLLDSVDLNEGSDCEEMLLGSVNLSHSAMSLSERKRSSSAPCALDSERSSSAPCALDSETDAVASVLTSAPAAAAAPLPAPTVVAPKQHADLIKLFTPLLRSSRILASGAVGGGATNHVGVKSQQKGGVQVCRSVRALATI